MGSKEEVEQLRKLYSSYYPQWGYKLYYCWLTLKRKVRFWGNKIEGWQFLRKLLFFPPTPYKLCIHVYQCSISVSSFTKWLSPFLVYLDILCKWWVYAYCMKRWLPVDFPRMYLKPAGSPEKVFLQSVDISFQLHCEGFHSSLAQKENAGIKLMKIKAFLPSFSLETTSSSRQSSFSPSAKEYFNFLNWDVKKNDK